MYLRKHDVYSACCELNFDGARSILDASTDKDMKLNYVLYQCNFTRWSCLHQACWNSQFEIGKLFIDIGGKDLVMMTSCMKDTAFHYACVHGASFDVIKMFVDVGGKELVTAKNERGENVLHHICSTSMRYTGALEKIKLILQVAGVAIGFT